MKYDIKVKEDQSFKIMQFSDTTTFLAKGTTHLASWANHVLSHTWVRYPGFSGHGVKCPILTTVVPGFSGDLICCTIRSKWGPFGDLYLARKNLLCVWNKLFLGPRWGQKSLDLRSRDFCPHLEPRGELIAQYRPPMSFRYSIHCIWIKWILYMG